VKQRLVMTLALVGALYYAIQGGEFRTTDLFRQRAREQGLLDTIAQLRRDVDSLRAFRRALETDPAVQERVARERYGMVKGDHEIVYRFIEPARSKP
jgi:cell division protein FtsB